MASDKVANCNQFLRCYFICLSKVFDRILHALQHCAGIRVVVLVLVAAGLVKDVILYFTGTVQKQNAWNISTIW